MLTLEVFLQALIQLVLFSLLPFIWWFVTQRKKQSFFEWAGLKKPIIAERKKFYAVLVVATFIFLVFSLTLLYSMREVETATAIFEGLGIQGLLAAFFYSIVQTALAEEILFRGFLAKGLIRKFGFHQGNLFQSILFGVIHAFLFIQAGGFLRAILIMVIIGGNAWVLGYLNEKLAGGSILPSLFSHAFSNIISSLIALFRLF